MKNILDLTLLGLMVCIQYGIATEPKSEQVGLPPGWKLPEIEKATPPYGVEGKIYVLAWKIEEDKRPLRVETCLVLKVLPDESEEGRWSLAQLCRHPLSKEPQWHLSMVYSLGGPGRPLLPDRQINHLKRFKERPNNKAVYASLGFDDVYWNFDLDEGWSYVGCSVCEDAWQAALGEKPTKFFGVEKK